MEKQRIEYLDAMRGFTMILVVFSHVLMCTFLKPAHSGFSFNDIFVTFRMPLFYFLSGFLMFKSGRFNCLEGTVDFIKKKFIVQIIPTVLFSLAFCFVFAKSYDALLNDTAKQGFWFTYTLYFYFIIFSIGDWLISRICSGKAKLSIGILGAVFVYALSKYSLSNACPWHGSNLYNWIGVNNLQFFLYFFFGDPRQQKMDGLHSFSFHRSATALAGPVLQECTDKPQLLSLFYSEKHFQFFRDYGCLCLFP